MASSSSRIEGGTQMLSEVVRKTIQSIKEIVGNHSDIDIYSALKETNMDPNETVQKLLNQDPFHEVKRRRNKKNENMVHDGSIDRRQHSEYGGQEMKLNPSSDRNIRKGYVRNALPGFSKEFRVVRDTVNQNMTREAKPASPLLATSGTEKVASSVSGRGPLGSGNASKVLKDPINPQHRAAQDANSGGMYRKVEEKQVRVSSSASHVGKPSPTRPDSVTMTTISSARYSSSTDPVHMMSPVFWPSASVEAIKREVGVVGVRCQFSDNTNSFLPITTFSNSLTGAQVSTEPFHSFSTISKSGDQLNQTSESVMPSMSVNKSSISSQNGGRLHSPPVVHQKGSQPSKELKPKSSQTPRLNGPCVIDTPKKSVSPSALDAKDVEPEAAKMQDKLAQSNIHENQNVIIAQHIRVHESDRSKLTFGSFGAEFGSTRNLLNRFQSEVTEESNREPTASSSVSPPESSINEASGRELLDLLAATAESSHMQFPCLYDPQPQQRAAFANPHHHPGPAMGGNVGVKVAVASPPGAQVGTHRQPRLNRRNRTKNCRKYR